MQACPGVKWSDGEWPAALWRNPMKRIPDKLPAKLARYLRDRGVNIERLATALADKSVSAAVREGLLSTAQDEAERLKQMNMPKKPHPDAVWGWGQWWTPTNCYEDAFRFLFDLEPSGTLVHGNVQRAGSSSRLVRCDHAWVEVKRGRKWFVIDGFSACMSAEPMLRTEYYRHLDAEADARYSLEEACRLVNETDWYKAWHKSAARASTRALR
jgi:hypothetical protein